MDVDREDRVYSSSSGESLTDGGSTDGSFIEEAFEEDGQWEMILVPRRDVRSAIYYLWIRYVCMYFP